MADQQPPTAASPRIDAGMRNTIPALPVREVAAAATDYRDRFGFTVPHLDEGFAVLVRDDAIIHLWAARDESWRTRDDVAQRPVSTGAESFLAGTASCRIQVSGVDALYVELGRHDVLHPRSQEGVTRTDFGTREFATLDLDGNLVEFVEWDARA